MRAHVLLSGFCAGTPQPEPLPSGPGPPALPPLRFPLPGSGQWPRRLDTPSPRPASRFLCQTKRDGRWGPGGACGGTFPHPPGCHSYRRRDTGPAALARGPRAPMWGWGLGGVEVQEGLASPAHPPVPPTAPPPCPLPPRTGQDQAGAATPSRPAGTHMACHTLAGTHSPRSHIRRWRCVDVHRTEYTHRHPVAQTRHTVAHSSHMDMHI